MKFSKRHPQRGHGKKSTNPAPCVARKRSDHSRRERVRRPGPRHAAAWTAKRGQERAKPGPQPGQIPRLRHQQEAGTQWAQPALGSYVRADRGPCSGPSGPHQARTESLTCYTALHSSHKTLTRLTPADRGVSSPVSEALAAASPPSGSVTAPHRGQGQPLVTTLSQAPTSVATKYLELSQGQHPETT